MDHLASGAFVLDHNVTIKKCCKAFHRKLINVVSYSFDDFAQDCSMDIMEKFESYRADDSSPGTWIWWRVRKVADKINRRYSVRPDAIFWGLSELVALPDNDFVNGIENYVELRHALERANPGQVAAALTLFEGMSSMEIKESIGVQRCTRDRRLRTLGESLGYSR